MADPITIEELSRRERVAFAQDIKEYFPNAVASESPRFKATYKGLYIGYGMTEDEAVKDAIGGYED